MSPTLSPSVACFMCLLAAVCAASLPAGAQTNGASYSSSAEYRAMLDELHTPAPSPAFLATGRRPKAGPQLKVRARQDSRSLQLTTRSVRYTIDKEAGSLTVANLRTGSTWALTAALTPAANKAPGAPSVGTQSRPPNPLTITGDGNRWTLSGPASSTCPSMTLELLNDSLARLTCAGAAMQGHEVALDVSGGGPYFGLGERFWQAGLAGTDLLVRPQDRFGEPGHDYVYVAIPLLYGPGGLGLYADTVFSSTFNVNATDSAFRMSFAVHPVSIYLFAGADPKAILTAYTALTGRPPNPPLWTFGPWITALGGEGAVLDEAEKIRAMDIPASALWVYDQLDEPHNLGWPFWFSSYYGDPRTFTDKLHARGFKVLTYVHPYVRKLMLPYPSPSPAYNKGREEGLLAVGTDGLPAGPGFEPVRTGNIDFTNPRAVDWWQGMITSAVRDGGFDGWMEDFGEWIDDTDRFAAGAGATIAGVYPLLYHKITDRIFMALNPDVVSFSRSGAPGSQAFSPAMWGSDQSSNWSRDYGLPSVVTAGITAGMSGYSSWGPDIIGFGTSKELWMRWAEFGALTPIMRDHPWDRPRGYVDLWYDASTRALFRKYAILHSTLLPYFAAYAAEAHRTGVPILRHTVLEFPDDPRAATAEYQYLLGEHLLVAPVVEQGALTRKLYLPAGEWISYWSGEHYTGGREVTLPAPLEQIPLLVRAPALLPLKPEAETASLNWADHQILSGPLVWRYYGIAAAPSSGGSNPADAAFTLPDGTSARAHGEGTTVVIEGAAPAPRSYEVILQASAAPRALSLNAQPLVSVAAPVASSAQVTGWWYDPGTHELHARFSAATFRLSVDGLP